MSPDSPYPAAPVAPASPPRSAGPGARGRVGLRSLLVLVAVAALGLAATPREVPWLAAGPPVALLAGRFVPRAAAGLAWAGLGLAGLIEMGLGWPLPAWFYGPIATALVAAPWHQLAGAEGGGRRARRPLLLGAGLATTLALYFVPWTTRKPFLETLDSIRPGMPVAEVLTRMRGYKLGTGWPNPGGPPEVTTPERARALTRGRLFFRHSDEPAFNADWGIVDVRDGRVVSVEFSPD